MVASCFFIVIMPSSLLQGMSHSWRRCTMSSVMHFVGDLCRPSRAVWCRRNGRFAHHGDALIVVEDADIRGLQNGWVSVLHVDHIDTMQADALKLVLRSQKW